MEKTSIAIAFKGGEMTVLATGDVDGVLAAYRKAELDPTNDFVGMLRKPIWYKRNTPSRNKARHEEALKATEKQEVEESKSESNESAAEARAEVDRIYAEKVEADRLQAERDEQTLKLNIELAEMEAKERAQQQAADDARMQAAQDSVVEVAPSTEMEKAARKSKKK